MRVLGNDGFKQLEVLSQELKKLFLKTKKKFRISPMMNLKSDDNVAIVPTKFVSITTNCFKLVGLFSKFYLIIILCNLAVTFSLLNQ